ncbi:hypothetical protein TNCV_2163921 [Trichonephila clavipes]|nr:hypothetical protein TNCV_2163921 [Trichonephila clavipes]
MDYRKGNNICQNKRKKFPTQRHGVLFCHARRSLVRVMLVPPARAHRISVSNVTLKKTTARFHSPTEPEDPQEISRDFHRKIEEDTLTGDCSEDDEDLMDIQSGPSTSSPEESECGINDLLHFPGTAVV